MGDKITLIIIAIFILAIIAGFTHRKIASLLADIKEKLLEKKETEEVTRGLI